MRIRSLLLAAAASLAASTLAAAATKPSTEWVGKQVPIEVFAQFPAIEAPRMSPDGKWVAAKLRVDKRQVLALLPINQPGVQPQVIARDGDFSTDKLGERQIVNYRWLDNGLILIGINSRDEYFGQWFDNVRYVSFNLATRKVVPLGWENTFAGTELLWASRVGSGVPRILLQRRTIETNTGRGSNGAGTVEETPEVIEVDATTGKTSIVMQPNIGAQGWGADEDGVIRLGSSSNGDTGRVSVMYRPDGSSPMKTVYSGVADRYVDAPLPQMMLAKSGKAYSLMSKDGYAALYEFDLTTMKPGNKVFGVDGYDIDGPLLSADRSQIEGIAYTGAREARVYLSPRMKEIQQVLEESYGKGDVLIETTDAKRELIVFRVAKLGQAQSWYVFNAATGSIGRLGYDNDTLKDAELNPVSVVRYPASDGKQIEAILTMPRHRTGAKNLPVIVLPHGGPWARDSADWDRYGWAQALAESGYVVIQPNYRGSTGYGREWLKLSEKNWGYRMQDDLNDAVTWLAGQGIADPKRACVMGWSYGGYAASRAAQRDGSRYRCAISGAGVHDLPAMVRYDKGYLGSFNATRALGSAGTDLTDVSPGLHPEQYSIPILIIHGARDQRVPVAQSRDLVARLKRAGKVEGRDFVYVEQPLNTHNLLREEDRVELLQEVKRFLDKYNPA